MDIDFDDPQDLPRGSEAKYEHPAVIVSSDIFNRTIDTITVVPITGADKARAPFPHEVALRRGDGGLSKDSLAQPCLIRSLDRYKRVIRIRGKLSEMAMMAISLQLFNHLGGLPLDGEP